MGRIKQRVKDEVQEYAESDRLPARQQQDLLKIFFQVSQKHQDNPRAEGDVQEQRHRKPGKLSAKDGGSRRWWKRPDRADQRQQRGQRTKRGQAREGRVREPLRSQAESQQRQGANQNDAATLIFKHA